MPRMTRVTRSRSPATRVFARIFYAALIAGIVAGLLVTGIQSLKAWPLILKAEVYEQKAEATEEAKLGHAMHEGHEWAPANGAQRMLFTATANVLAGIGFALLLGAAFALRGGVDWRYGLVWGLAGYATFVLAPALGLPPELPGSEAAPLAARQTWWIGTALATGGGLAVVAFVGEQLWKAAGLLLILLPHVIGAPQRIDSSAVVPPDLTVNFIAVSLIGNLLFWLALGGITALAFSRLDRPARAAPA